MDSLTFRPSLDGLEDRLVPAVSPTDVVAAYTRTVENADEITDLGNKLGRPRTTQNIQFLATRLPAIAAQSRADAALLAEYRSELLTQIAANPVLGGSVAPFAQTVGFAQVRALITAGFAELYGPGFGAVPPVPPPPPPVVPTPPVFGPDLSGTTGTSTASSDNSTVTATGTPDSTLPFSLTDPNFRTLSSGVKVWDVVTGPGATVAAGDTITAHYTGYLTNGTKFDSSLDRGQPFTTALNSTQVIQGWVDGIAGMQAGGTRRLFIPAALAYGSQSRTGIPANSDLVFEVQLLSKS